MHAIRGRIEQYKILMQHEQLQPYLAKIERFSKDALYSMLKLEHQIILKPIVGMDFIIVTKHQGMYQIKTKVRVVDMLEEGLYEYIQQIIGARNYIIQSHFHTTLLSKKGYHCLVTVQRRNERWYVTHSSKQNLNIIETVACFRHQVQLQKVAIMAAEQLGPSYTNCESIVIELIFNLAGDIVITDSFLHFSVSKWNQYQSIANFMPQTDLLTTSTFSCYLSWYSLVFLKPCNGQQGKGIIKIHKRGMRNYEIQMGRQKWAIAGIEQVYEHVRKIAPIDENYIIQRGIELATIDNRFMDIRVMTQKVANDWYVTGKVVKVAGPHFFVTNAAQSILTLQQALRQSTVLSKFHGQLENQIDTVCKAASHLLDQSAERNIIGFDIAVTDLGRIWVIEGNYVPDLSFFQTLEDTTMYNTIMNYKLMNRSPKKDG
ncbi:YheC/YheD family protein [Solibacillus sp. MA9]|uniref:YheC/YheD family protein n=1 Tax=Solibacillus palustris TaxID=2908203 RepID=A0ABS9UDB3_9BACL|nr:YheC/YheD family protein [Solibacillus sp. MA9]MCH7322325.1 YheC/YheD family protein [Solibacillus sp. MA9]